MRDCETHDGAVVEVEVVEVVDGEDPEDLLVEGHGQVEVCAHRVADVSDPVLVRRRGIVRELQIERVL